MTLDNIRRKEKILKERIKKLDDEGKKELRRLYRAYGRGFVDLVLLCSLK